ncbi:MAG: excisionase family DNA binding protein [Candidatus Omnitrophota bacterium]|jgi:excisionase family DNA binding protein
MKLKEISAYIHVHPMTIYRLLNSRKLPGFKVGGQWRTKKIILDEWLRDNSEFVEIEIKANMRSKSVKA